MNRCKTCQHWKRFTDAFDKGYHGAHAGKCTSPKFVYSESPVPRDGLSYWDSESYSAGFETGENFGCVHHNGVSASAPSPSDGNGQSGDSLRNKTGTSG